MNAWLLAAWIGCQGFDGVTTIKALSRPEFYESNRILGGRRLVPLKIGVNVGAFLWYRQSKKHTIPVMFAAVGCAAGGINAWRINK